MATTKDRNDLWNPNVTYIIGHQRPDTDSIASAIGYAWYLGQKGKPDMVAARAGQVGSQAAFALGYFGQKPPRVVSNAAPTFAHVAEHLKPVTAQTLLTQAMGRFADGQRLIAVVEDNGKLLGGLSPLALARAYVQASSGKIDAARQTCGDFIESSPVLLAGERISDHRRALLRSDGDDFLIVADGARYLGTTTRRQLLEPPRARLFLVDHNELGQAVPGADEAEIVGVLDHHRLGNAPTASPIPFVIDPVGSTSTLVAEACRRHDLIPPENITGVLLSGILSDTLVFRSPTSTERDKSVAGWLAGLCDTDIAEYGRSLAHASPGLADRSADDILDGDRKNYEMAGKVVSIAQVEVTSFEELPERRDDLLDAMASRRSRESLAMICLMVTDIVTVHSHMLCCGEDDIITNLPYHHIDPSEFDLGQTVSRKKQLVPALQSVLEEISGS